MCTSVSMGSFVTYVLETAGVCVSVSACLLVTRVPKIAGVFLHDGAFRDCSWYLIVAV